ncbi:hypothetical protein V3C99_006567 [Haemonchus contortus]
MHIGTHGMEWNERLLEFIMSTHTIHGNSQFQKHSHLRWTWESPGGRFHHGIDHIIFERRFSLTDVAVFRSFTRDWTVVSSALDFVLRALARLFQRYLSECKVPTSWKTSKSVWLYKKADSDGISNCRPMCLLSVVYKSLSLCLFSHASL